MNTDTPHPDETLYRPASGEARAVGVTLKTLQDAIKELQFYKLLPAQTIAAGVLVMTAKMFADGEPGAIPILLVVSGIAWHFITRARILPRQK